MQIGIGLPNPVPGTTGQTLIDWARRAEARGFASLATIDRVAYPTYDSLITLAAAGAVTQRIELLTNVLLGPTHNPVLLAKAAASADQLSGGRLTLGVSVGGRPDDYVAAGLEFRNRGKRWDQDLEVLDKAWRGEPVAGSSKPVTPAPVRGTIPLLIGGTSEAALKRILRWGTGWTVGGAAPEMAVSFAERVRQAWREEGREGRPRLVALTYFALGAGAAEGIAGYIADYYGSAPWVEQMLQRLPTTSDAVRETARRFEDAGFDELIFDPTIAQVEQVDLLAEVALTR